VVLASEAKTPFILRRSTGILSADLALGGGWHAGGTVEVRGEESVGKTYFANLTAGQVQKHYGDASRILVFSTEIRPDKSFARMCSFCIAYSDHEIAEMDEVRQKRGMDPFSPEDIADLKHQIGDVVILTADTADTGLEIVLSALRAGLFQLIIIESLGAFLTKMVEEGDVSDRHYGGPAGVVTTYQNMAYPLFMMDRPDGTMLETTLLGINQARANIGGTKYDPNTKGALGAFAWKHACLASLELTRGAQIRPDSKADPIGRLVRFHLTKGKAGTHDGKHGKYDFYHFPKVEPVFWRDHETTWFGGASIYDDMVQVACDMGIVEQSGAWIKFAGEQFQGKENFGNFVADHPEAQELIREQALERAGILVRYS
jgi:RecA/RadA recombinase